MLILGVDSTGKSASCAVVSNGVVLAETFVNDGYTHGERLAPMILAILKEAKVDVSKLDGIAVTVGPGSFTGIRVGLSTVMGIAYPFNIPCIPVSTLECLALAATDFNGTVCPVIDARRGQVYNALFKNGKRICQDRAIDARELGDLEGDVLILGDGAEVTMPFVKGGILAGDDIILQHAKYAALNADMNNAVPPEKLQPVYLRISQAERERNERIAAENR